MKIQARNRQISTLAVRNVEPMGYATKLLVFILLKESPSNSNGTLRLYREMYYILEATVSIQSSSAVFSVTCSPENLAAKGDGRPFSHVQCWVMRFIGDTWKRNI